VKNNVKEERIHIFHPSHLEIWMSEKGKKIIKMNEARRS